MTPADLAALTAILDDIPEVCYDADAMEYWEPTPCPRCRLREFIREHSKEVA